MSDINRKFTLAARPVGYPKPSDFDLVTEPIPVPEDGEVLVHTNYLSVDPYMRGRMNDRASYAPNVQIGEVMVGTVVGEVVASKNPDFQVGDIATGGLGWQEYGVSDGNNLRKVDPTLAPISTALGILGMPGLTAYFGLLEICNPQAGENSFRLGSSGSGRFFGWTDRKDKGLPRRWQRRQRRERSITSWTNSALTPHSTIKPPRITAQS